MADRSHTLRKHQLVYLGALRVHPSIFESRFPADCSMRRCNGNCCQDGVWTDLLERDTILRSADFVRAHMDPEQERDSSRWFDPNVRDDRDFPSGLAAATEVVNGACIFLNRERRCVLQKASKDAGTDLKPFFCRSFPITIDHAELLVDDGDYSPDCCTPAPADTSTVFDLCSEELQHVLGAEGLVELTELFESYRRDTGLKPK